MRRPLVAAIVILRIGWPAVAGAQAPAPGPGAFPALPPIGLPLAPIGLPLPSIGLPPLRGEPSVQRGSLPTPGPDPQSPGFGSRRHLRGGSEVIFYVPTFGWGLPQPDYTAVSTASVPGAATIARKPERTTGSVRFDVQPEGVLQLYVDGFFVGTPTDLSGELELEAGPHAIEIRAPGYETLVVAVNITPRRSITYRGALKSAGVQPTPDPAGRQQPDAATAAAPPVVIPPTTIYFIPGCYLGNVPPGNVVMPANCDLSRLITRTP